MSKYSDMLTTPTAPAVDKPTAGKYSAMLATQDNQHPGELGNFAENLMAGLGSVALGAKQAVLDAPAKWIADHFPALDKVGAAMGLPTAAQGAAQTQDTIDQGKPFSDRLLWRSGGGLVGNLGGNALEAYAVGRLLKGVPGGPTAANKLQALAPKTAPYVGAATVGGITGALQPTGTNESNMGGVVGGALGGVLGQAAGQAIGAGARAVKSFLGQQAAGVQAQRMIADALQKIGASRNDAILPQYSGLRDEVAKALSVGGIIDDAALRRKLEFTALGLQPTLGTVGRDAQQFATEHTLAGINGAGKALADIERNNNAGLIGTLNKAGAAKSNLSFDRGGDYAAGQAIHSPIKSLLEQAQDKVGALYRAAEDLNGRPIELDHVAFTQRAGDLVDKTGKNYFLPDEFKRILNDVATGKYPLTVGTAEQIKTALASATRSAKDGNARAALSAVRQALEETPVMGQKMAGTELSVPGQLWPTTPNAGQEAIDAFRAARNAHKEMMGVIESAPAVKAVFEGVEPDKFFQKHVIGANVNDLRKTAALLSQNPATLEQIKSDIVGWLKNKALNGASDEVGKFSQSGFNRAMNSFGRDKLALFFSPQELAQLQSVGRVASYIQVAPAGARVNSSNTAAQVANMVGHMTGGNALMNMAKRAASSLGDYSRASTATAATIPVKAPPTPVSVQQTNELLRILGGGTGAASGGR